MKKLIATAALVLLAACGEKAPEAPAGGAGPPPMPEPLTMALRPEATGGEALYIEKCAMCHGPNGMGQGLLARRLDQPDLEKRDDLTVDYVIQSARQGIGNMPMIARGEVSDEQMQQIAEYLAAGPHGAAK